MLSDVADQTCVTIVVVDSKIVIIRNALPQTNDRYARQEKVTLHGLAIAHGFIEFGMDESRRFIDADVPEFVHQGHQRLHTKGLRYLGAHRQSCYDDSRRLVVLDRKERGHDHYFRRRIDVQSVVHARALNYQVVKRGQAFNRGGDVASNNRSLSLTCVVVRHTVIKALRAIQARRGTLIHGVCAVEI